MLCVIFLKNNIIINELIKKLRISFPAAVLTNDSNNIQNSINNVLTVYFTNHEKKEELFTLSGCNDVTSFDVITDELDDVISNVKEFLAKVYCDSKWRRIPERLYIETTNACNAKCIMCPHERMQRPIKFMNDYLFERIIMELANEDLSNTTIFMHKEGEPLLDKDIVSRIKIVKNKLNCKEVAINTNASLLTNQLALELMDSSIDTIYISIDGARKKTYERIRLGLSFDSVIANVRYLLDNIALCKSNIKVILQMLCNDENDEEVLEFKQYWANYNAEIFIKRFHSYLDGGLSSFSTKLASVQSIACVDPFNTLVIYADGGIGCCCWDYENTFHLGNVAKDSIIDVFNGTKIKSILMNHIYQDCRTLNPCNRCMRIYGNDAITGISGGKRVFIR